MADMEKLHQRIELALEEKEYEEACDIAKRAVKENPADGISWYYLLLADNRVDSPEAFRTWKTDWRQQEACLQAVSHEGNAERLRQLGREWAYCRAESLREQKRYEAALAYYEEAGDLKDSIERAGECREIVEKAREQQRRLAAEMDEKDAAAAENGKCAEHKKKTAVQKKGEGKKARAKAIDVGNIEYAVKVCEEFLGKGAGEASEEVRKLADDMHDLTTAAKWGGQLDEEQAYGELERLSPFWRVYGAERREGELAARLYDAKQGAAAGLPWDDEIACYWAGVAASKGNKLGCRQLGRFYEAGIGVKPNLKLAGHFYNASDSREDADYFQSYTQAIRQLGGSMDVTDAYEEASVPPHFQMSEAARRLGAYWKLHKRTEEAKLGLNQRTAFRLQELLLARRDEFDAVFRHQKSIDKKNDIVATITALLAILFWIAWAVFVLFMPLFIEKYTGSKTGNLHAAGILTYIPVCAVVSILLYFLLDSPVMFLEKQQKKRTRRIVGNIRQAYDQAVRETNQDSCEEYRQYMDWSGRCQEMQKALGVKTAGWKHAYLMYYSAGIHGARNPDEADQYAVIMEKRDSSIQLPYSPSPAVVWLLKRMQEEEMPLDLLEVAKQYGRNSRNWRESKEAWKTVFALECILYHAVCKLKAELQWSQHGFWRTNTEMLYELSRIYGLGREKLNQKEEAGIGLIVADFTAEIYKVRYYAGQKAALADLVHIYSSLDVDEEYRWARTALAQRCPEFASNAINYMAGYGSDPLFSKEELRKYADDILASPVSEENRKKVEALQKKISEWEKQKRELDRVMRERQETQRIQARAAIEQELDRRERNLNLLFGDGYMTNEEMYLSGRQSISDYVENDIYRSVRRSEMEKRQQEREM